MQNVKRINLPLDTLAEMFDRDPSFVNARRYRDVALEYWEDDMIGDESLLLVLHKIRNSEEPNAK